MKTRAWLVSGLTAVLIVGMMSFVGCNGQGDEQVGPTTTSLLSEATMAAGVDEDGQPVQPTSVFATDGDGFFCSVKVTDAPPDTEITVKWVYVGGEVEEEVGSNYVILEETVVVEGTRHVPIAYPRPPIPDYEWPRGEYELVLHVEGEEELSLPFKVE